MTKLNDNPAPGNYEMQDMFQVKNWQTNIGAFGSTEKKFASINSSKENPGPGQYDQKGFVPKKFSVKKNCKGQ